MKTFADLMAPAQLAACFGAVRQRSAAPGFDGVTPEVFAQDLGPRCEALSQALVRGRYAPARLLRRRIDKPGGGTRRLAVPTVADRVVIEALRRALHNPIEAALSDAAYAYRPGRSPRAAVAALLGRVREGAAWAALGDVREFFDSVPIALVMEGLRGLSLEPALLLVIERLLSAHALRPGRGLAQGAALSPMLSNLALLPFDRRVLRAGFGLLRYSDNLCVPAASEGEARRALAALRRELGRLTLLLKPEASQVAEVRRGFLWLGFFIGPGGAQVSEGAVAALRARVTAAAAGAGEAQEELRARLQPIVRGWAQYFDAPLPEGVDLGPHAALVRSLLAAGGAQGMGQLDPDEEVDAHAWGGAEDEADEGEGEGEGGGDEAARLLDEADRRAAAGEFARAEALYEEARRAAERPAARAGEEEAAAVSEEALDAFIGHFAAGQERFELARGMKDGRRDFALHERPVGPAEVREHLLGRGALAVRPLLGDGRCSIGVIDVDGRGPGDEVAVMACAEALRGAARALGVRVWLEQTGGRGAHLWVPVQGRVPAAAMGGLLGRVVAAAGTPAAGVKVAALPGGRDAPELGQQAMTLPLGLHVESGRRSRLWIAEGEEVGAELRELLGAEGNDPARVGEIGGQDQETAAGPERAAAGPAGVPSGAEVSAWEELGGAVERVMTGCAVLRHLSEKAAAVGHLDHGERLSVLYGLGHLGEAGERAVHVIISRCQNYDREETERQIRRLSGLPIGCARLRQKHATPELLPLCRCDFGDVGKRGGYATPLLHAVGFRRDWRAELRRRRQADERLRDPAARAGLGVRVEEAEEERGAGVEVAGAPPHEWA